MFMKYWALTAILIICDTSYAEPPLTNPMKIATSAYIGISTIHVKCVGNLSVDQKIAFGKDGVLKTPFLYEFWADDKGHFKISVEDHNTRHEAAFDGDQYQWLDMSDKQLYVATRPPDDIAFLPINPFFVPISWSIPEEWSISSRKLMWTDVSTEAGYPSKRIPVATPTTNPSVNMNHDLSYDLPGGEQVTLGKKGLLVQRFKYRVLAREQSKPPYQIQEVAADDGRILNVYNIEYQDILTDDGLKRQYPIALHAETLSFDQKTAAQLDVTIDAPEINKAFPPNTFRIDPRRARSVFDLNSKQPVVPNITKNSQVPVNIGTTQPSR